MGDFNWSLVTFSCQVQEIIQVFSSTHGHRTLPPAALRLLNWEKEKERWTKVLASKSLRTLEGVEEEEEEVNEEGDDDKKEERMLWSTA